MPTTVVKLPVITVRHRTYGTRSGWEAVTIAPIVTTHTIGLRPTAEEVVAIVERMKSAGMVNPLTVIEVAR